VTGVASPSKRAISAAESTSSFPPETREGAMEHQLLYPVKRFGSLFRGYNFRLLVLRIVWCINILLFASVVWAFAFLLLNFD
jgi:hypothetical protein